MQIRFELNQRHGRGYQVHFIMPPVDSVYDAEPLTLYEAGSHAATLIEQVNKEFKTNYKPHQVISITDEALQANKSIDVGSMKMFRDLKTGDYTNIYPAPTQPDFEKTVIDDEEAYLMSGRGVVLACFLSWKDDHKPKARQFLEAYCRLIASRGAKGGAATLFSRLDALSIDEGAAWIKQTYGQYIRGDGGEVIAILEGLSK